MSWTRLGWSGHMKDTLYMSTSTRLLDEWTQFFSDSPTSPALEVRLMPNWADFFFLLLARQFFFCYLDPNTTNSNWCRPFCIDTTLLTLARWRINDIPDIFIFFTSLCCLTSPSCCVIACARLISIIIRIIHGSIYCLVYSSAECCLRRSMVTIVYKLSNIHSHLRLFRHRNVCTLWFDILRRFFTSAMYNLRTRQRTAKN